MARRRHRNGLFFRRTEDPGKDLYAYLYIMTILFCIMCVTAGKLQKTPSRQPGPEKNRLPATTTLAAISPEKLGRLVKENNTVFLVYGSSRYRPAQDAEKLEADGRIAITVDEKGAKRKMLYLEEQQTRGVLLSEYLSTFAHLGDLGIGVSFAERVK